MRKASPRLSRPLKSFDVTFRAGETSNNMEEAELIKKLKEGDENAYRRFMRLHKDRVYGIIYSYSGANRDADDIAQEVFITVFRKIRKFREKSSLSTWLYRITVNKCGDFFRMGKMKTAELDEAVISAEDNSMDNILKLNAARKLLGAIPGKYRMPLLLRETEGFTYSEIAKILKKSETNVKVMIFRAREKLRKLKNELQ